MNPPSETPDERTTSLRFLKIWHSVFVLNLDYSISGDTPATHLRAESVGDPGACLLGKTLAGFPEQRRQSKAMTDLDEHHRQFHRLASEVVRLNQAGQFASARDLFHGRFATVSDAVLKAIDGLDEGQAEAEAAPSAPVQRIWDRSYETGIPEVDRRHHAIAMLIEQVLLNHRVPCSQTDASTFIDILGKMIEQEIATETPFLENLAAGDNEQIRDHLEAHVGIQAYLAALQAMIAAGEALSLDEVGTYLASWYIEHLVTYDLELPLPARPA